MQSTSCEMLGWMKHKLESRLPGEISIPSDIQMIPPSWQKVKRNKRNLLMKVKEESEQADLKLSIQRTKIIASGPITSWQMGKQWKECQIYLFIYFGSKITADGDSSHEIKRCLFLGIKSMINLNSMLKIRYYFANKGPSSQSYCFSRSRDWMWELAYEESWTLKNRCFSTVVLEKVLESPLTARRSNQSIL